MNSNVGALLLQTSLSDLCARLSELDPPAVVGLEGFMNSGKSFLADEIGEKLACVVIHTDNFVAPSDESLPYVERLNYDLLKLSLSKGASGSSIVLVDGICLRLILARVQVAPALFVYVKRMAPSGLWNDGFHLEDFESDDQSVNGEPERSDLRYHVIERPHERAQFVFHRVE
jgi:hypothetical protein